jgi:hypothetical protein
MKDCTDRHVNEVTDIPYFEGDFWTSKMEDLIEEETGVRQIKVYLFFTGNLFITELQ